MLKFVMLFGTPVLFAQERNCVMLLTVSRVAANLAVRQPSQTRPRCYRQIGGYGQCRGKTHLTTESHKALGDSKSFHASLKHRPMFFRFLEVNEDMTRFVLQCLLHFRKGRVLVPVHRD